MANILNAQLEVIPLIFNHLIFDRDSFSCFTKVLIIWERLQPRHYVKFVLESLDWDKLYHYHHHHTEVTRDQFLGFLSYSVRHNVDQAMFLNSTRHAFMNIRPEHHLRVLSYLSNTHLPSRFALLFFKALYRPYEIDTTANEMFTLINHTVMQSKVEEIMCLLTNMYESLFLIDHLLPPFTFCSRARNVIQFNNLPGPPLEEDMWNSLCTNAVSGNYRKDGEYWAEGLKKEHIWKSKCKKCALQLIVFKILFGAME